MGVYTKLSMTGMNAIQLNAGIMVDSFNPASGVAGNILGLTSGGFQFNANPQYQDFGEDIDNAPPNTKQFLRLTHYEPRSSGTFASITAALAKKLNAAGAVSDGKLIPSHTLTMEDFADFWILSDYSPYNEGTGVAGYFAVHIMNGLNTAGFQWQSGKNEKGKYAFDFLGYYDAEHVDIVPFEIYVKAGTGTAQNGIRLSERVIHLDANEAAENHQVTLIAYTTPDNATVTWSSSATSVATVSGGTVTGASAGTAIITASITDSNSVTYTDTCTVIVVSGGA